MPPALETATARTAEIYFELDRFELADDQRRIELSGRWFGVRGRRFVRPTLTMTADGEPQRLLADIEHKPWEPEEGSDWQAAFPWELDGTAVSDLELGVAPDIAVELPPPGASGQRAPLIRTLRESRRFGEPRARRERDPDPAARVLEAERQENERLRTELAEALEARVETDAAIARRDSALTKLDEMAAEREAAVQERDAAGQKSNAAIRERDAAVQDRDAAARARDAAVQARDLSLAESERLARTVAELQAQLRQASEAAQRAESERRQLLLELERSQVSAAARSALRANPAVSRRHLGWRRASVVSGSQASWATRALALAVLIAVLLAFVLIAHVV